jgi:hypothetical protein
VMMARAPLQAGPGSRLGTAGIIGAIWACGPNWVRDAATYGQYHLPELSDGVDGAGAIAAAKAQRWPESLAERQLRRGQAAGRAA